MSSHALRQAPRPLVLAVVVAVGCARAQLAPATTAAAPPVNTPDLAIATDAAAGSLLADVRALDTTIAVEMRYATADNFTGAPLPGYEGNRAMLRREAAASLARVQRRLAGRGLGLHVWDAYRPVRATNAMVDWTKRVGREDLLGDGYIASRSRHNLGLAIDLTLADRATGRLLDMGTPFDTFAPDAHTMHASGAVLQNRLTLEAAMEAEGFTNYNREWWHYSYQLPAGAEELRFDLVIH